MTVFQKIVVGDVVSLNNGGGSMVVEALQNEAIACVWMDGGKVCRDQFPAVCLKHSAGDFDGLSDLIIAGVTHSDAELEQILRAAGNA